MLTKHLLPCLIILLLIGVTIADIWDPVDVILKKAISEKTTPGLSALVGDHNGILYHKTFGSLTYGEAPPKHPHNIPISLETQYDIASLTKVVGATTAAMLMYEKGLLDLNMKISHPKLLGTLYSSNGKENITVLNLLIHDSGLPPGPYPLYSSKDFGCPESFKPRPSLSFSCTSRVYKAVLAQKVVRPIGQETVYSDLSMITLSFIIGKLSKDNHITNEKMLRPDCLNAFADGDPGLYICHYEAFLKRHVFDFYNMNRTTYLPPRNTWGLIAPTWNETYGLRKEVVQGEVSDENAFAIGGISGHAGIFSNSEDLYKLGLQLLAPKTGQLNDTTVKLFSKVHDYNKSSRALGWDTNHYALNTHRGCGNFSESTFTHTGYTGTQICIDPSRGIVAILLTNRVYPVKTDNADSVKYLRRNFSNAVKDIVDTHYRTNVKQTFE